MADVTKEVLRELLGVLSSPGYGERTKASKCKELLAKLDAEPEEWRCVSNGSKHGAAGGWYVCVNCTKAWKCNEQPPICKGAPKAGPLSGGKPMPKTGGPILRCVNCSWIGDQLYKQCEWHAENYPQPANAPQSLTGLGPGADAENVTSGDYCGVSRADPPIDATSPRAWVCVDGTYLPNPNGILTVDGNTFQASVLPLPTAEALGRAVIDESKRIVFSEDNRDDHAWRNRVGAAILRAMGVSDAK